MLSSVSNTRPNRFFKNPFDLGSVFGMDFAKAIRPAKRFRIASG
jgi:hypothetical protein